MQSLIKLKLLCIIIHNGIHLAAREWICIYSYRNRMIQDWTVWYIQLRSTARAKQRGKFPFLPEDLSLMILTSLYNCRQRRRRRHWRQRRPIQQKTKQNKKNIVANLLSVLYKSYHFLVVATYDSSQQLFLRFYKYPCYALNSLRPIDAYMRR